MGHQEVLRALESGQQKRLEEVLTLHLRQIENDIRSLRGQYPQYFLPPEQ